MKDDQRTEAILESNKIVIEIINDNLQRIDETTIPALKDMLENLNAELRDNISIRNNRGAEWENHFTDIALVSKTT